MKSKVLLLALATTVISFAAKAQITYGIRAGVNFANIKGKSNTGDDLDDNKLKTGFHIGFNAEVPVAPEFYVQPGLLFSTKGTHISLTGDDVKVNLSYLEVPINLLFKPAVGPGKLLLGFGPYFAFAVGGKYKYGNNDASYKFKNRVTLSDLSKDPYVKRMDAGANFLFGYELSSKISVQFNAQLGLSKINPKITDYPGTDKTKYKNTGFGISFGYRF